MQISGAGLLQVAGQAEAQSSKIKGCSQCFSALIKIGVSFT